MENLIFKVEIYLLNTQIIDRLLFFAHFDFPLWNVAPRVRASSTSKVQIPSCLLFNLETKCGWKADMVVYTCFMYLEE